MLQLDSPFYEGRDASAIVSWAANNPLLVELDAPGDRRSAWWAGPYGGGIQMVTASTDPASTPSCPTARWYSLIDALAPLGGPQDRLVGDSAA